MAEQSRDASVDDVPAVLVVDDEREVADAYALRLRDVADVTVAYGGDGALEAVDDGEFDVLLLDRHMPGTSGDEVLETLDEQGFVGKVVMVTAIDPGFDVLDMPFDDYLCKPVDREDVRAAVDQQCTVLGYELIGEYFAAEAKGQVMAAELPADELASHERYQELVARADGLERRIGRLIDDPAAVLATFDDVGRTSN
jgi:CheY-like chemotaxis protein